MTKGKHTEAQMIEALKQVEAGANLVSLPSRFRIQARFTVLCWICLLMVRLPIRCQERVTPPAILGVGPTAQKGDHPTTAAGSGSNPLGSIYLVASEGLRQETLDAIIALTSIRIIDNSKKLSAKQISRLLYGTTSRPYVKALEELNRSGNEESVDLRTFRTVKTFVAPTFFGRHLQEYTGDRVGPDDSSREVVGANYIALSTSDLKKINAALTIIAKDPSIKNKNNQYLAGDHLIPSWQLTSNGCGTAAPNDAKPYASLGDWRFPATVKPKPVLLAIIDSGIASRDDHNPKIGELQPVISDETVDPRFTLWNNESYHKSYRQDQSGLCRDDAFGCDVTTNTGTIQDASTDPDVHGHGTHVAGLAAGLVLRSDQLPRDSIPLMSIKVVGNDGKIRAGVASVALSYAIRHGADIINISMIGQSTDDLLAKIKAAEEKNILIVVAAGNDIDGEGENLDEVDGQQAYYPALFGAKQPNVITVAALDSDNNNAADLAEFSNYGRAIVTIAAPGVRVPSTVPGPGNQRTDIRCGTSQAAPIVTLTAALLKMQNPSLVPGDIKVRIQASADARGDLTDVVRFGGVLNMQKALNYRRDIIETKRQLNEDASQQHLFCGEIDKARPLLVDSNGHTTTQPWDNIVKINFNFNGGDSPDRILIQDSGSWNLQEPLYGRIRLDTVLLRSEDGKLAKSFKREEIQDLIPRLSTARKEKQSSLLCGSLSR